MIIDLILDRKGGDEYNARDFYFYCLGYPGYEAISIAMDYGTERDVKRELCNYIDSEGYNPQIKNYVNSVNWL